MSLSEIYLLLRLCTIKCSILFHGPSVSVLPLALPGLWSKCTILFAYEAEVGTLVHPFLGFWLFSFCKCFNFFCFSYLHSSFSPPVAHCNIKASNILLDEELMPRISDCGIAILRPLTSNSVKLKVSTIANHFPHAFEKSKFNVNRHLNLQSIKPATLRLIMLNQEVITQSVTYTLLELYCWSY